MIKQHTQQMKPSLYHRLRGHLNRRQVPAVVLGVPTLAFALALILLYADSRPATLDAAAGGATIHIESNRDTLIFPGDCIDLQWDVRGIAAIYVMKRGTTGVGQRTVCPIGGDIPFQIVFQDGTTQTYTLAVERLYQTPALGLLLIGFVTAAVALAYRVCGVPGALVVGTLVIMGPVLSAYATLAADFTSHIHWAEVTARSGIIRTLPPHFLFHVLAIGLAAVLRGLSIARSAFLVALLAQVMTVLGLYYLLTVFTRGADKGRHMPVLLGTVAFALTLTGPIGVLLKVPHIILTSAFIYPNLYHSPTMLVMRPLAIGLFIALIGPPEQNARQSGRRLVSITLLTVLVTLAKPSYTLAVVPAFCLVIAVQVLRTRSPRDVLAALVLVGAAVPVLAWQYLYLYGSNSAGIVHEKVASIRFAPLRLYQLWGVSGQSAALQIGLSILLPLMVYGLYFKSAVKDRRLNFAWIAFLCAMATLLLLIEEPQSHAGNLVWGAEITLLMLFAASTGFLLQENIPLSAQLCDWRLIAATLAWIAHLASHLSVLL